MFDKMLRLTNSSSKAVKLRNYLCAGKNKVFNKDEFNAWAMARHKRF
jgi:hypothetical protein